MVLLTKKISISTKYIVPKWLWRESERNFFL